MARQPGRQIKRCFTLTEALMVVMIMMILISFISPSIKAVIEKSHAMICANNLRQLYKVSDLYEGDFGVVVPTYNNDQGTWNAGWMTSFSEYLYDRHIDRNSQIHRWYYTAKGHLHQHPKPISCPTHDSLYEIPDNAPAVFPYVFGMNYSANRTYSGLTDAELKNINAKRSKRYTDFKETIIFIAPTTRTSGPDFYNSDANFHFIDYRHNYRSNLLFFGGQVKSVAFGEVKKKWIF